MADFLRCKDCKHDKGKCVGVSRRASHKNCFEPKVMTNADRIRAMSDEELAKLIVKHKPLYSWCKGVREIWMKPNVTKVQAWLEWLNQPAEESVK